MTPVEIKVVTISVDELRRIVREEVSATLNQTNEPRMPTPAQRDDAWLRTDEAATYLGCSKAHLARLRMIGDGPRYAKMRRGKQGQVRYRRSDLDAWLQQTLRANTSQ